MQYIQPQLGARPCMYKPASNFKPHVGCKRIT